MPDLERIVIVGASLAGLSALEALRDEGWDGHVSVVGAEEHLPYDRPPLSKEVLRGEATPESTQLRDDGAYDTLDADWILGRRAVALDVEGRAVELEGGERVPFDGCVIATGAAPRLLPGTPDLPGIFTVRTLEDAVTLRRVLDASPRVAVVGAGFIGLEVAASCRMRGLEVTVVEALEVPLARAIGHELGAAMAALHRDHGVDLRLGVGVAAFEGDGRVERVALADGSAVEADVVVVGVGVRPETEWLESSGLGIDDGVVCDATCLAAPAVVAAGDVCRWPNPLFDEVMRVEHWDNAVQQGQHAARRLLKGEKAGPFAPVPYFWSDQYERKIQFVGRTGPEVRVVDGDLSGERFTAVYGRAGRLVGAISVKNARLLMKYRQLIEQRARWDDALSAASG